MKTKIIIPTIISIVFVGSFGYAVYSGFFSEPSFEVDKYPD